jgi:hypothetical protein
MFPAVLDSNLYWMSLVVNCNVFNVISISSLKLPKKTQGIPPYQYQENHKLSSTLKPKEVATGSSLWMGIHLRIPRFHSVANDECRLTLLGCNLIPVKQGHFGCDPAVPCGLVVPQDTKDSSDSQWQILSIFAIEHCDFWSKCHRISCGINGGGQPNNFHLI